MKKRLLQIVSVVLSAVLLLSVMSVSVFAVNENDGNTASGSTADNTVVSGSGEFDYVAYKAQNSALPMADANIILSGSDFSSANDSGVVVKEEYEGEKNVIVWDSEKGSVDYIFNVPKDGIYNIRIKYVALDSSERELDFGVKIDGAYPFVGAEALELPRMWVDATEMRQDDYGNQFAAEQTPYKGFTEKALYDITGASVYPLEFAFTAGAHTLTIVTNSETWAIASVALCVPDSAAPTYSQMKEQYAASGYKPAVAQPLVVEGESAWLKSTRSLIAYADNSSPLVEPASPTKSLINYIGNTNWKLPNEELTWVIDVPEDGLYKLGIMYKQDQVLNGFSYRHLKIDGKTPFQECSNIRFPYSVSWEYLQFGDNNGAYEFYLTKGKHYLSLAGTLGELAPSYYDLKNIASDIGSLYLEIVMITGETPDANRDYDLHITIPRFLERLQEYITRIDDICNRITSFTGKGTNSLVASLRNAQRVLQSMYDNKFTAQEYVNDYYTQYTTLSSWLYSMQEMALCVDQMQIIPSDSNFNFKKVNIFKKIGFGIERFLISFSDSYSRISVVKEDSVSLRIWVNWGRDQAQVLNNLINESFTTYAEKELGYPVSVNLELVNADIIKGMLSNNAPDLSLHLARSQPVNLAMRGALADLTQFDDYESVLDRFGDTASIPYEYGDGVYALPDQQAFYLMFYRTDIFEALGLDIPQTWDEFLATSAVLQRNNMNSCLPYTKITTAGTVNTGVGGLNMFCSILMQHGGNIYNDERNVCLLDSPLSLSAFSYWTDMYTKYKVPVEASFYNRFRVGTMPLGIQTYTTYTTLAEAAPEITNRWGIALIPGTQKEDGTIDRTISGSGTGCSILEDSKVKLEAWTFLKWWTSADTQSRYNTNVESILGTISRITTANLEAFENMTLERKDLSILLEQRNWIVEVPEVPGSYYVSRSVDQAFWNVINDVSAPKDALARWGVEANSEIERKIAEYSK